MPVKYSVTKTVWEADYVSAADVAQLKRDWGLPV